MTSVELVKRGVWTSDEEVSASGHVSPLELSEVATPMAGSSNNDAADMLRLGKKQLYKRNFRLFATIGFATIFTSTWEYCLVSTASGLTNGGFGGLFAQFVWTFFGSLTVCMSLAEMASMAPTAGGQYHWVSEFAPPRYQKFFSYVAGWTSTLAWQPSLAGGLYPAMSTLEALGYYRNNDFAFTAWQASLIMIGLGFLTVPFNTVWRHWLPRFESLVLVLHLCGFFAVIIPLWVMNPKNSSSEVFGEVINSGGWSSTGLSMLVGQVATFYTMAGADSAVHLSEEVEDAGLTVPRSIVWSFLLNSAMGFVMLITMMFCMGDLQDAIELGQPFVSAFSNTGSTAAATGLTIILLTLLVAGNNTCTTTQSRQMWAFARDRGLPGSRWLSRIDARWNVPINCIMVTIVINTILCLINLGSSLAFNIVISLCSTGYLATYFCSIGCLISARLRGDTLPPARWSLGRAGLPINIAATLWSAQVFVFCFFPVELPVTLATMNWVVVIFGAAVIFAAGFYALYGYRHYTGPVEYVRGRSQHGDVLQGIEVEVEGKEGGITVR